MASKFKRNLKVIFIFAVVLVSIVFILEGAIKMLFPLKYKEYVFRYSSEYNLDPYLVFSIIKAESSFNPDATSPKNARGLMQVTDDTAFWIAEMMGIKDFKVEYLYDPDTNIKFGCWLLNNLEKQFDSRVLVVASYNAGAACVRSWLNDSKYSATGESLDVIPYKETEIYTKRVENFYSIYKMLYEKDI
ncbi:lytic transglycosylase domain-containing protein [Acetivibrio straminisolvens]|uniref:Soluble lytic murein transglycosylase n=1 Tax=Acetivibrio straminisolvens JCM 21531 TaxID=1294263 RepID=W4V797_9FIRM|nr:lytic transglycosylase domain-containing protein [Acetivibrio straminisolvens]GAE89082.1 soluble lytic murein transglycosylase precursor [Acetivibrio straminisolvens JCM 21531]